ncbi:MAG: glycosyltransferase [Planctomycetota bacterium]
MRVAFLCSNFPPEIHAGTEMVVVALGRELARRGVEVTAVTTSEHVHDGTDVRREAYAGIEVLRVFKKLDEWDQNGLDRPRLVAIVEDLLRQARPDLLHVHSFSGLGAGHGQRARAAGVPVVMTFHDVWVTCPRYFRVPPDGITCPSGSGREPCVPCINLALGLPDPDVVRRALYGRDRSVRAEVEAADVLTAPSLTAARMVRTHLPTDRDIAVVPHGLLAPLPAAERAPAPAPGERLRVGTFGNLVEPKGVLELVRAVAGADCELHLGGSFLDLEFARQVREEAQQRGVELVYHGPYGPDVPHPALGLHLAVFPSKCQETYGLVVDEALARGVPAVVSDRGALHERGAGGGVEVTALPSLGRVVHDLVADRDRLARLRAAVPAALPTIAAAADRYLELYDDAKAAR